jgi:hypothetical protein
MGRHSCDTFEGMTKNDEKMIRQSQLDIRLLVIR